MRKAKDQPLLNAVAAEIKARRAVLKISQEEFAHRAGVNRSYVAKLEVADQQPSLGVLLDLAAALEADPAEIVSGIVRRRRNEMRKRPAKP